MRFPRRFAFWALLLATTSGRGVGSSSEPVVNPVGESPEAAGFTFRVSTPAVSLAEDPEGRYAIRIEGFGVLERRPEAPDLPYKVVRVAIPDGVEPRLEVVLEAEDARPGFRPRPVARRFADSAGPDTEPRVTEVRRESPAFYEGKGTFPAEVAWLGDIGVFRDQRYVEVHLAPVRFDRQSPGLRIARSFKVAVRFDGDRGERREPRPDPKLETVYRNSFVNYAQGTTFRLSMTAPPGGLLAPAPASPEATPRYRIKVRANGVVRLDYARMAATGFPSYALSSWKLTSNGVEVPIEVHDPNGNDLLDNIPAQPEWVQFYGQALDFDPKTVLNQDQGGPTLNLYEVADVTDENVYFLTVETGARARMPDLAAAPQGMMPAADFEAVSHQETDNVWVPLGGNDPWYWKPFLTAPASRTDAVPLPGLKSGSLPARVLVRVRGFTESSVYPDHHSRITLQYDATPGDDLAWNDDDGTFDGRMVYTHDFTWTYPGTGQQLQSPAYVKTEAVTVPGVTNTIVLDWIEVRYRRAFAASGDALTFDYPNGEAEFEITGFSSGPTSPPSVYEITGLAGGTGIVSPVRRTGATVAGVGPYTIRFHVAEDTSIPTGTTRRFVVAGDSGVSVPADADFPADTVSDLRDTTNQADMIVISRPDILGAQASPVLNQLLSLRLAQQGITSKVVSLQDVQDEFNDGLYGPNAIRNFLKWVMSTAPGEGWSTPKPFYVLLIGDGSYDTKHNETATAVSDFVPTVIVLDSDYQLAYLASDNALAAVVGTDHLADLMIGRIAVRSDTEARDALTKIYSYESAPPSGNWTRRALFVSDRGHTGSNGVIDPNDGADFEATIAEAIAYMQAPPYTYTNLRYWSDYCTSTSCNHTKMTNDIEAALKETGGSGVGAVIMQFVGHGNFQIWSDDAIFAQGWNNRLDVSALENPTKLPWLIVGDCLSGGFHTTLDHSMGEDWLKTSTGGAIAVSAPTNLGYSTEHHAITEVIWGDLFGSHKERTLDVPVMDTLSRLCGDADYAGCQGFVLLGDPAQRLALKSVAPATAVSAAGGNAVVNLAWQASSTPGTITYDIWRTENLAGSYTRVATGRTGTAYADSGVVNAKTYYYYLVAVDSEGFESRWSNFNSDCVVSGPDCLRATPLNPNPPAVPTWQAVQPVTDPETGARLNLAWNANGESDFKNYTIHYGTAPGVYTTHVDASKNTAYQLTNLQNNVRYYLALTATNTSSMTSGYSVEQSAVPTFVRGVRSPGFIATLHVDKSVTLLDAVLSWTAVTTDIYGKATTIARYEVYRALSPDFSLATATLLGTPTGTSFTDSQALTAGKPTYYYGVRAIDTAGNPGGLDNQLPNGIDVLTALVSGGHVVLSWPAVTTTFDPPAWPTRIDHYDVYATDHPFTRADIRNGTITKVASPTGTSVDVGTPVPTQYYSVLSVDSKGNLSSF